MLGWTLLSACTKGKQLVRNLSLRCEEYLDLVARRLNKRPRKTPEFETPAERTSACDASTG